MSEPPHASSDYVSLESYGLFAIDHFKERSGNWQCRIRRSSP